MSVECHTFSVKEAAKVLGIGLSITYALVRSGEIPSIKLGGRVLIPKRALAEMLGDTAAGEGPATGSTKATRNAQRMGHLDGARS
jgi:excisionase family DNA binding protein